MPEPITASTTDPVAPAVTPAAPPVAPAPAAIPAPSRPEGLPEKFDSVVALANSYGELERKQSERDGKKIQDPTAVGALAPDATTAVLAESIGIDLTQTQKDFAADNKLRDDDYAKWAKAGYGKAFIDEQYGMRHELQNFRQTTIEAKLEGIAGGKSQYETLIHWASGLPEGDRSRLNGMLENSNTAEGAVRELLQRHTEAVGGGNATTLIEGGTADSGGVQPFLSQFEYRQAASDPRYTNDTEYREQVHARLAASEDIHKLKQR